MKRKSFCKNIAILFYLLIICLLAACGTNSGTVTNGDITEQTENSIETDESAPLQNNVSDEAVDMVEDTVEPAMEADETAETSEIPEEQPEESKEVVDLIVFGGQSNMSGTGGDASLAPKVSEEAGQEYRAISDPEKLYPIVEPFGANENNINGLFEMPGGKKGSLVSSFVNKYYELTGTKVIAVCASRGEMAMDDFLAPEISDDILKRYTDAKKYLTDNGYEIGHIYLVWLQGESDALRHLSQDAYRTKMDDFIRPFFIEGMQKVFFITPGRTIDETKIYSNIIDSQMNMAKTSSYYALGTNILTKVSTEYMVDLYHYNQHVLNMVGEEAAESVAYYSINNQEKVVFDYKNLCPFVPDGCENQPVEEDIFVDLTKININEEY